MKLVTNRKMRLLKNNEIIPKDCICYDLKLGWCRAGDTLVGKPWKRCSLNHPSIIMVDDK